MMIFIKKIRIRCVKTGFRLLGGEISVWNRYGSASICSRTEFVFCPDRKTFFHSADISLFVFPEKCSLFFKKIGITFPDHFRAGRNFEYNFFSHIPPVYEGHLIVSDKGIDFSGSVMFDFFCRTLPFFMEPRINGSKFTHKNPDTDNESPCPDRSVSNSSCKTEEIQSENVVKFFFCKMFAQYTAEIHSRRTDREICTEEEFF